MDAIWFVYILRCHDGSLYTGITTDLARRSAQHNAGRAARYTRGRGPVTVVYHETHASRGLALRREASVKALSRDAKEKLIVQGADRGDPVLGRSCRSPRRRPRTSEGACAP